MICLRPRSSEGVESVRCNFLWKLVTFPRHRSASLWPLRGSQGSEPGNLFLYWGCCCSAAEPAGVKGVIRSQDMSGFRYFRCPTKGPYHRPWRWTLHIPPVDLERLFRLSSVAQNPTASVVDSAVDFFPGRSFSQIVRHVGCSSSSFLFKDMLVYQGSDLMTVRDCTAKPPFTKSGKHYMNH